MADERERAGHALAMVNVIVEKSDEFQARYRSYVDRFGGAVVMNGLGQALAAELAAANTDSVSEGSQARAQAHRALADHVGDWLTRPGGVYEGARDLLSAMISSDQRHYLRAQAETLAWLTWHKKLCHAHLSQEVRE